MFSLQYAWVHYQPMNHRHFSPSPALTSADPAALGLCPERLQILVDRLEQDIASGRLPGAVLMFHGNIVHGSAGNITPFPRKIVYLTLNAVSNYIRKPTRPEWIAHQDFAPIVPVADDALVHYARSYRQAAE